MPWSCQCLWSDGCKLVGCVPHLTLSWQEWTLEQHNCCLYFLQLPFWLLSDLLPLSVTLWLPRGLQAPLLDFDAIWITHCALHLLAVSATFEFWTFEWIFSVCFRDKNSKEKKLNHKEKGQRKGLVFLGVCCLNSVTYNTPIGISTCCFNYNKQTFVGGDECLICPRLQLIIYMPVTLHSRTIQLLSNFNTQFRYIIFTFGGHCVDLRECWLTTQTVVTNRECPPLTVLTWNVAMGPTLIRQAWLLLPPLPCFGVFW